MGNTGNSKLRYVRGKEFKVIASKAAPDADHSDIVVVKAFPCDVRQFDDDASKRILQFTISTGGIDREGDTINPEGWTNLDTFQKTGVVLWAHDSRLPPLAKPLATWVEGESVKSRAQWLDKDFGNHEHVQFADLIYNMYDKGFMKGVSVGFRPLVFHENMERGGWWPIDYIKQELLEYSAVPVFANTDALHEAGKSGLDMAPLKMWAEYVLDDGSKIVTVPKAFAESIHKGLSSASVQVPEAIEGDASDQVEDTKSAQQEDESGAEKATSSPLPGDDESASSVDGGVPLVVSEPGSASTEVDADDDGDDSPTKNQLFDDAMEAIDKAHKRAMVEINDALSVVTRAGVLLLSCVDEATLASVREQIDSALAKLGKTNEGEHNDNKGDGAAVVNAESDGDASDSHNTIAITKEQLDYFMTTIKDEVAMRTTGKLPG